MNTISNSSISQKLPWSANAWLFRDNDPDKEHEPIDPPDTGGGMGSGLGGDDYKQDYDDPPVPIDPPTNQSGSSS